MSQNENEQATPEEELTPEERALSALRSRLARPQPRAADEAPDEPEEATAGSGSATGFVGMLGKRQLDGEPSTGSGMEEEAARRSRYPLQMAREVMPAGTPVAPKPEAPARWWYRLALPLAWLLAGLLVVIGGWAVGALVYMSQHNANSVPPIMVPADVHYPLIAWRYNAGPLGDYTAASRMMAWMMLLCLPVAGLLVLVAGMLRRRMRQ